MKIRKSYVLGLTGAVLLSLNMVITAVAQTSDTVTVDGEIVSTASITLNTDSVSFGDITSTGLKPTTDSVTGSVSTTFGGTAPTVTRTVANAPTGFNPLLTSISGSPAEAHNTTVPNPDAINDRYYLQIDGDEPLGSFSFTVTYTVSTI